MEVVKIILWTIQHEDILNDIENNGMHVITDINQTIFEECDVKECAAYNWMYKQMCQKISNPPENVKYPIWAWYMYEGKRKKPDMRHCGFTEKGTNIVRLTLDVPEEEVLLSDFDLWHYVLNNWYLAISEEEDLIFEQKSFEEQKLLVENSWQRIYDLKSEDDGYIFGKNTNKSIQATFWTLKKEYIVSVEKFIAR